jgi:hypothetical protein
MGSRQFALADFQSKKEAEQLAQAVFWNEKEPFHAKRHFFRAKTAFPRWKGRIWGRRRETGINRQDRSAESDSSLNHNHTHDPNLSEPGKGLGLRLRVGLGDNR